MLSTKNGCFHHNSNYTSLKRSLLSVIVPMTMAAAFFSTLSAPASFGASSPTPNAIATPTYVGVLFHNVLTSPITVAAGKTVGGINQVTGNSPRAAQYGVTARAVVYVQAGNNETTCLVKLAGGAVWGTPITVPANSTVSIPFEDTSPGFPGESYNVAILIQAGTGGSLTVLPGSTLILEGVASQPGNNAY